MVIHTKKNAELHTHELKKASIKAANIYTVDRSPKFKGGKIATNENKKFRRSTIHMAGVDQSKVDKTTESWLDKIEDRLSYKRENFIITKKLFRK